MGSKEVVGRRARRRKFGRQCTALAVVVVELLVVERRIWFVLSWMFVGSRPRGVFIWSSPPFDVC